MLSSAIFFELFTNTYVWNMCSSDTQQFFNKKKYNDHTSTYTNTTDVWVWTFTHTDTTVVWMWLMCREDIHHLHVLFTAESQVRVGSHQHMSSGAIWCVRSWPVASTTLCLVLSITMTIKTSISSWFSDASQESSV